MRRTKEAADRPYALFMSNIITVLVWIANRFFVKVTKSQFFKQNILTIGHFCCIVRKEQND